MPVVEAVAAFAPPSDLGRRLEAAMSGAALMAQAEGISDQDEIRALMLEARDRVLATEE